MLDWVFLDSRVTIKTLGYIPGWLSEASPLSAEEQIDKGYQYGGFQPFQGFTLNKDNSLSYPGDPKLKPLAQARLRDELVVFYQYDWVAVIQPDRSFVVARID